MSIKVSECVSVKMLKKAESNKEEENERQRIIGKAAQEKKCTQRHTLTHTYI